MENNNQIIYFLHINITSTVIYNLQKLSIYMISFSFSFN